MRLKIPVFIIKATVVAPRTDSGRDLGAVHGWCLAEIKEPSKECNNDLLTRKKITLRPLGNYEKKFRVT